MTQLLQTQEHSIFDVVTFHNIRMLCSSRYQKGHAYFTRKFKRNSLKYGIIPEVLFTILYYALFCNSIQERLRAPHPLPHLSALPPTGNQAFNEVSGGGGEVSEETVGNQMMRY